MSLTIEQRTHLEHRLRDERARTVELLNGIADARGKVSQREAAGDLSVMPSHAADLGTDTINQELDESNAARASRELSDIDSALERLYKTPDKFGLCEESGREIPYERLVVIPWARTCDD
jgi:RNA polymerase-binding transcription factor DksA